jgi:hypothetical protein
MSFMSDAKGERRSTAEREQDGVLVNLPRTRPQRASARRAAARKSALGANSGSGALAAERKQVGRGKPAVAGPSGKRAASARKRPTAKRRTSSAPRRDTAPRQGFETDGESMTGSLQPPGGIELVGSAAEIVGELAKVGLSAGERLLKDVFSRLPRS